MAMYGAILLIKWNNKSKQINKQLNKENAHTCTLEAHKYLNNNDNTPPE